MANAELCRSRLKAFVKSDKLMKEPEQFEKLLKEFEQALIESVSSKDKTVSH
ncbi:MAG: hypothetical protein ABSB71_09385 [Candidatus Bathyarchaeia archaeon]